MARSRSRWRTLATQIVGASFGRVFSVNAGRSGAVVNAEARGRSSLHAAAKQRTATANESRIGTTREGRIQNPKKGRSSGRGCSRWHAGGTAGTEPGSTVPEGKRGAPDFVLNQLLNCRTAYLIQLVSAGGSGRSAGASPQCCASVAEAVTLAMSLYAQVFTAVADETASPLFPARLDSRPTSNHVRWITK